MRRSDRIIGIVLGLLIGVAAVILFVFAGAGESIDSPSLEGSDRPAATAPEPDAGPRRAGEAGE